MLLSTVVKSSDMFGVSDMPVTLKLRMQQCRSFSEKPFESLSCSECWLTSLAFAYFSLIQIFSMVRPGRFAAPVSATNGWHSRTIGKIFRFHNTTTQEKPYIPSWI